MLILGIETSCDETAVALVEDGRKISIDLVASQVSFHSRYGGVIPEVASRKQIELINPLLREALTKSKTKWKNIDAVAVTAEPGLIGSLLVGISTASVLSYVNKIPLYEVNHVESHLYANFLANVVHRPSGSYVERELQMPFIGLVASGGHTSLFLVKDHQHLELLGSTRDDAAGEAFDKVAKLLGLPYPGGPQIQKYAKMGNPEAIKFPRPYLHGSYDFSFSGLKTAVAYYLKNTMHDGRCTMDGKLKADVAAGFQAAVVDTLVYKTVKAAKKNGIKRIAIGGGVAANKALRLMLRSETAKHGIELFIPPVRLCLDNAAMVAVRAYFKYQL
ncbi:tRNA (adenosine(37)-N6)-threonylcarbamoyltransferase complex transferase subunit TsaD [Candidatus Desantisbacteria bacterium CG_4_10_14_0_8_um_filter_48_22]|uniref:tRNA N6-adenosine threonylcarbamoyltransferase n=1 Tax=Candidatus Desantisbacteria bacterium CG_4_10_14_0_8_um_filter_48_22 TaxID=1974543 RepID=A0A2M7SDL3_9BACT|nr:MAG: tRNA (adenosine(37)-N6)-threonylcarbamoyltransferase complex transferase subunit TsaD [Candidatus Desantisbacteria bacterium CG1_02_49_89]PIV57341.1 MAG: tRNA (adenosine(37)-N6)-threonylcarbamoyltransferase complex transferase subunit TsaD [Candidatus Desantisbacteria bacterium CG02_land_8_20_14_3_00_49_13]PIZ17627.1 MAG: tRNA (adenosine(37)-N6)-threonylcarbamoyltransferase complex transferase subunit TsaD [Candidatus Desantisbacteria bacterium CG_4_10_14_0_8_um_filter_48_22]